MRRRRRRQRPELSEERKAELAAAYQRYLDRSGPKPRTVAKPKRKTRKRRTAPKKPQVPTVSRPTRLCDIDGCERPHDARGLCKRHYRRKYEYPRLKKQRAEARAANQTKTQKICSLEGCERPLLARGLCNRHWQRMRRRELGQCPEPGCTALIMAKGRCSKHYLELRERRCTVADCGKPLRTRGLCETCYAWSRRHGKPPVAVLPNRR